jgi:hypothetical protein
MRIDMEQAAYPGLYQQVRQVMRVERVAGFEEITFAYQTILDNVSLLNDDGTREINAVIASFGQVEVFNTGLIQGHGILTKAIGIRAIGRCSKWLYLRLLCPGKANAAKKKASVKKQKDSKTCARNTVRQNRIFIRWKRGTYPAVRIEVRFISAAISARRYVPAICVALVVNCRRITVEMNFFSKELRKGIKEWFSRKAGDNYIVI